MQKVTTDAARPSPTTGPAGAAKLLSARLSEARARQRLGTKATLGLMAEQATEVSGLWRDPQGHPQWRMRVGDGELWFDCPNDDVLGWLAAEAPQGDVILAGVRGEAGLLILDLVTPQGGEQVVASHYRLGNPLRAGR